MTDLEMTDIRPNEILQVRLQTLEAENKRLRAELDWMREKFLEAESKLWWDTPPPPEVGSVAVRVAAA